MSRLGRELKDFTFNFRSIMKQRQARLAAQPRSWRAHANSRLSTTHVLLIVAACAVVINSYAWQFVEVVPETGRWRLNIPGIVPKILTEHKKRSDRDPLEMPHIAVRRPVIVSDSDPRTERLKRVVANLLPVSGMDDRPVEIRLVETGEKTISAFVRPGPTNKIYVFNDLLELMSNDDQLAGVIAHELMHVKGEHPNEVISWLYWSAPILMTSVFLKVKASPWMFPWKFMGYSVLFGLPWIAVTLLPGHRLRETDSDVLGMLMMAEAGYDPREMIPLWEAIGAGVAKVRKEAPPEGRWVVEFIRRTVLKTHPEIPQRIRTLQEWMPKALAKREQSGHAALMDRAGATQILNTVAASPSPEAEVSL